MGGRVRLVFIEDKTAGGFDLANIDVPAALEGLEGLEEEAGQVGLEDLELRQEMTDRLEIMDRMDVLGHPVSLARSRRTKYQKLIIMEKSVRLLRIGPLIACV